jgi:hypothetical protein
MDPVAAEGSAAILLQKGVSMHSTIKGANALLADRARPTVAYIDGCKVGAGVYFRSRAQGAS